MATKINIPNLMSGGVVLRKEDHRYFQQDTNLEYLSVSRCLRQFKKPFDADRVSYFSARKKLRIELEREPKEWEIEARKIEVAREWKQTNMDSIDHGNKIHDGLEMADREFLAGRPNPSDFIRPLWERLYFEVFKQYDREYMVEQIVSSTMHRVAGMMDKPCQRAPGKKGIVDIYDYKTNLSKGIKFHSEYSEYFLEPFDYLEYCNYVEYCFQLSTYAAMLMAKGFSIGKLTIIDIRNVENAEYKLIPVPFMFQEARMILDISFKNFHKLINPLRGSIVTHDAIPV